MATLSGQRTVTTAGTAVRLSAASQLVNGPVMIKALTTNTGLVYVGNVNGDVADLNGYPLAAGDVVLFNRAGDLYEVWVDSAEDGEGVAWLSMEI